MPTDVNFLSGASLPIERNLFFDAMTSGQAYFGFARQQPEWGQIVIAKVNHNKPWPAGVMGQDGEADDPTGTELKFYDLNSPKVVNSTIPVGGRRIFLARILKSTPIETVDEYVPDFIPISEVETGQLYAEYIGENWIRIEGMNPLWQPTNVDEYDYYIFNWSPNTTNAYQNRMKISEISLFDYASTIIKVQLATSEEDPSDPAAKYVPSMILPEQDVGELQRIVNVNGEVVIAGLNPTFPIEDYVSSHFFVLDEEGVVIQDRMRFIEKVSDIEETFWVFEYETLTGKATIKVTSAQPIADQLAYYHESLPFKSVSAPVADNNPPGLSLNYIKDHSIGGSVFDPSGIQQIDASEVFFCRQVVDDSDEADLQAAIDGGASIAFREFDAGDGITVKYVISNVLSDAYFYDMDSVMVDKQFDNVDPTSEIYRQIFICYKPESSSGALCTLANYSNTELFNATKHGIDLGYLFYLANKIPVYRQYINGNENFTIIV